MSTVARKGGGALLIAYIILFVVVAAVAAAVLLGDDKTQAVVRLQPSTPPATAAPAASSTAVPLPAPAPRSAAASLPPPPQPAAAPVPAPPAPAVELAPAPPGAPPAAPAAKAEEPAAPAAVETAPPAPAAPAPPPPLASLYPPPPPEKPAPPDKVAASTAAPAVQGRGLTPTALLETGPHGPLPRIAADGRLPWIVNNGKFDHGTKLPRLGLVVTGLGLNAQATEDAIIRLPAEVTLAFVPYAENLPRWLQLAREFGHEALLLLPMESDSPADTGLGPRVLSSKAGTTENLDRLRWVLSRGTGYVGVVTWEGEKFLGENSRAGPVLQEIVQRGLLVMDSRQAKSNLVQQQADALGLPFAKSRGFLDSEPGVGALDRNLQQLEAIAKRSGFAVAMAVAFPETVKRLVDWSKTVGQRGFVLAPITGVTECKELCQQRVARHAAAVSTAGR